MKFDLEKLRFERISRKITQEKVASALGIHRSSYHKKEHGNNKMSVEEFATVLNVLGIPHSEISSFFTKNVADREQTTA